MTPEQEERLVSALERCADALTIIAVEQNAPIVMEGPPAAPESPTCQHPEEAIVRTAGNPPTKWCSICERTV